MKLPHPDRFWFSSLLLIFVSGISLLIVILSDRKDLTSAAVILGSTVLFLSGVLLIPFSRSEIIDGRFASLLQVQGMKTFCRVTTDLGIYGSACMLPREQTGYQTVMQFIPVSTYAGGNLEGDSFVTGEGGVGMLIPPAGLEWLHELQAHHNLVIPSEREEFSLLFRDIAIEVTEIAEGIAAEWSDSGIGITVEGYRLIEGCRRVSQESPACCTQNPCVLCSLFASCIAEGLNQPVRVERCIPRLNKRDVEMIFSVLEKN